MISVVATLQQRCGNVLIRSESDDVTTLETDVGTTLIFDGATTLWQRQKWRCDNVVTMSLCQLGETLKRYFWYFLRLNKFRSFFLLNDLTSF